MTTVVKMPALGESVLEGTVGKWLVAPGERVEKDKAVVEILTDKTDTEVSAPQTGVVTKWLVKEGDVVPVGGPLFELDENQTAGAVASKDAPQKAVAATATPAKTALSSTPATPPPPPAEPSASIKGSPSTRKRVRENGGPIEVAVSPQPQVAQARAQSVQVGSLAEALSLVTGAFKVPPYNPAPGDRTIPFSRRRRIIADHMVYSKITSPHVVTFAECDLHKTSLLRDAHKDALKKEGVNLTFLAFVAAATAKALREFPAVNARVLEDSYVELHDVNLGIAVETKDGLVVPVVRHADELRVRGLARAIDDVALKSRDGKLAPDDLANKTFTISNPGRKGNLVGGAIISQPNVGILRIGEIKKRVVVVERDGEDTMAIHPVMYMALSYDHRIVDGVAANGFLFRISELLQNGEFEV